MAGAAEQRGPSNVCPLRARDWSSQLVVGKSLEELDPLRGNSPQLIYQVLKALTPTGLDLSLIPAIDERVALSGRVASPREARWVGIGSDQSPSYCEKAPFALDNVGEVIRRAPRRSARMQTGRDRPLTVSTRNHAKRLLEGQHLCS
jgi:hypothetical protein